MKRLFDIVLCLVIIVFFWPVFLVVGLVVYWDSGPPILFQQKRFGHHGNPFELLKFRSMKFGSPEEFGKILRDYPGAMEQYQKYRKLPDDPRITSVGKILRQFSLDELPQVVNVLRGEMSIIGPRPYTLDELDVDSADDMKILQVVPGISGWWQVNGRNDRTIEERKELDRFYVDNISLRLDLRILFKTIFVVFSGTGK